MPKFTDNTYANETHCLNTIPNTIFLTFAIILTSFAGVCLNAGDIRIRWGQLRNCMEEKPHFPII